MLTARAGIDGRRGWRSGWLTWNGCGCRCGRTAAARPKRNQLLRLTWLSQLLAIALPGLLPWLLTGLREGVELAVLVNLHWAFARLLAGLLTWLLAWPLSGLLSRPERDQFPRITRRLLRRCTRRLLRRRCRTRVLRQYHARQWRGSRLEGVRCAQATGRKTRSGQGQREQSKNHGFHRSILAPQL